MSTWVSYWHSSNGKSIFSASLQTGWVLSHSFWFYGCLGKGVKTVLKNMGFENRPFSMRSNRYFCLKLRTEKHIIGKENHFSSSLCKKNKNNPPFGGIMKSNMQSPFCAEIDRKRHFFASTLLASCARLHRYFTVWAIKSTILHKNQNCFRCLNQKWITILISTSLYT